MGDTGSHSHRGSDRRCNMGDTGSHSHRGSDSHRCSYSHSYIPAYLPGNLLSHRSADFPGHWMTLLYWSLYGDRLGDYCAFFHGPCVTDIVHHSVCDCLAFGSGNRFTDSSGYITGDGGADRLGHCDALGNGDTLGDCTTGWDRDTSGYTGALGYTDTLWGLYGPRGLDRHRSTLFPCDGSAYGSRYSHRSDGSNGSYRSNGSNSSNSKSSLSCSQGSRRYTSSKSEELSISISISLGLGFSLSLTILGTNTQMCVTGSYVSDQ